MATVVVLCVSIFGLESYDKKTVCKLVHIIRCVASDVGHRYAERPANIIVSFRD